MGEAKQAPAKHRRGVEARRLLRHFHAGALATQSAAAPGYPYASALPFCTDQRGRVVVLISHLAEHTRNLLADPRAGFLVFAPGPQVQEQARISQLGDMAPVGDEALAARYLRLHPQAAQLLEIGGFRFFRLEPRSLRYIAGFGSIHTIAAESFLAPELPIAREEAAIIGHMNAEHARNLRDYCRHAHGIEPDTCEMAGIDCDGFDVRADDALLRFEFAGEVHDADEARAALVELARASRA